MKHVLTFDNFSGDELSSIIRLAHKIKQNPSQYAKRLEDRWLLLMFQKTSTRTRISFEVGMKKLGGNAVVMDWDSSNFAISPIRYEAQYVARHMDMVMARLKSHDDTMALAEFASIPIINGCDDKFHPCQALADLLTVYETAGGFEDQTITFTGIHNNVANSLAEACSKVGLRLILVTPESSPAAAEASNMEAWKASGWVEQMESLREAAEQSQFVYTDTWIDMEFFNDASYQAEKERRIKKMLPYQLSAENLGASQAYIMHDMPIHPGYEISADLVESPRSVIYQQAENRMYAQQALMLTLMGAAD